MVHSSRCVDLCALKVQSSREIQCNLGYTFTKIWQFRTNKTHTHTHSSWRMVHAKLCLESHVKLVCLFERCGKQFKIPATLDHLGLASGLRCRVWTQIRRSCYSSLIGIYPRTAKSAVAHSPELALPGIHTTKLMTGEFNKQNTTMPTIEGTSNARSLSTPTLTAKICTCTFVETMTTKLTTITAYQSKPPDLHTTTSE